MLSPLAQGQGFLLTQTAFFVFPAELEVTPVTGAMHPPKSYDSETRKAWEGMGAACAVGLT